MHSRTVSWSDYYKYYARKSCKYFGFHVQITVTYLGGFDLGDASIVRFTENRIVLAVPLLIPPSALS